MECAELYRISNDTNPFANEIVHGNLFASTSVRIGSGFPEVIYYGHSPGLMFGIRQAKRETIVHDSPNTGYCCCVSRVHTYVSWLAPCHQPTGCQRSANSIFRAKRSHAPWIQLHARASLHFRSIHTVDVVSDTSYWLFGQTFL